MPQGALYLLREQSAIVAKIPLQRVAIDHDPILIAIARDAVAVVLPVRMDLGSAIGDDDRDRFEHSLEFLGEGVDRIDDQRFELVWATGL